MTDDKPEVGLEKIECDNCYGVQRPHRKEGCQICNGKGYCGFKIEEEDATTILNALNQADESEQSWLLGSDEAIYSKHIHNYRLGIIKKALAIMQDKETK